MNLLYIIIPVYNEEKSIVDLITLIKKEGYKNIILIDDGSTDGTYSVVKNLKITILRHFLNRGKGAAIKTGIEAAKMLKASYVITLDADGQHNPKDIKLLYKYVQKKYDVVLGYRSFTLNSMPISRIVLNYIANILTYFVSGVLVKDSQCGMRAYSRKAIELIDTATDRYEFDTEIIREVTKHNMSFVEIPISTHYTEYSLTKKNRQNFYNGLQTLYRMIFSI